MMIQIVIACCFLFVLCSSSVVKVEEGELAGTTHQLPDGRIIDAFFGVPYAAPPIFKYRFKEPQPLKPWIGLWNATKLPSVCLQLERLPLEYSTVGEEDCLYLNIFTPKLPIDGVNPLLNVMVFFHGGAFTYGSGGIYYPNNILQYGDIVFVNFNYRLGPLGFFSSGDDTAPGNFGLKDQIAALKWIQRNIIHFGGNPKSVTIAGCSAGAVIVHYHFISPLSEGLFQKGISISGNALNPWTLPKNVTEKSVHLAALLGCPIDTTYNMMKCLRSRPAKAIVEQTRNFQTWKHTPFSPFGPVVEPASSNAFISLHPFELIVNGKVKDLPLMSSVTKDEGLYPAAEFIPYEHVLKELNENWNEIAPDLLLYNYNIPEHEKNVVSEAIKKHYFNDKPISKETIKELVQMIGDRLYYNEIFYGTKLHNLVIKSNVYCYKFNYRGKHSYTNLHAMNSEDYGVSHGDDEQYFSNYFFFRSSEVTEEDKEMAKFVSSIFINFMKTGNPATGIEIWEPLSKNQDSTLTCLNINSPSDLEFKDISNPAANEFWKTTLPYEYSLYSPDSVLNRDEL